MSHIHIERTHPFSFAEARDIAFAWAEQAENEFGMACTYEEGEHEDLVSFTRSGVNGTLKVCGQQFELDAKLGFLLGAFKDKIEAEIVKNLDGLLATHGQAHQKEAIPEEKEAAKPKKAPRSKKGASA